MTRSISHAGREPRFAALLAPAVLVTLVAAGLALGADELKVIQQPTFWIVGQWTRIMVQTPADCGKLEVTHPQQLALLDRWPHRAGDKVQRFYFRSKAPLKSGDMVFKSAKHTLALPVRVMSWQEALTEKFEREIAPGWSWTGTLKLPRLFPIDGKDERKSGLSYLAAEALDKERESYRRNLRNHADAALDQVQDIRKLFESVPESTIPRAGVNSAYNTKAPKGCPVCGTKVFEGRSAFYPWTLDREKHPFKIYCPECQRRYPSNDFANDDFTSGEFPDDGFGYFDANGWPYNFIGYYMLQAIRGGERRTEAFSRFYLASGDKRFARASTVLLFRIAEQFLNLAFNINQRNRHMRDSVWAGRFPQQGTPAPSHSTWFSAGLFQSAVWSIGVERFYAVAFERLQDYWAEGDPELIQFLQANHHPEIKSMQDVKDFIETGYFRTAAQACLDHSVQGNGPSEQAMALRLAQFLNTPRAIELVEWAFNNTRHGMRYYLRNNFYIDGSGYESPGYNNAHYGGTLMSADQLDRLVELRPEQYRQANFPLLADDPKFRAMFDHNINMTLISRTNANVGDDGDLAYTHPLPLKPGASLAKQYWVSAFRRWPGDVNYARALWDAAAGKPVRQLTDAGLRAKVTEIVSREGPYLDLPSLVQDGFGHVILRSGQKDDQRALWMRYGTMHGHFQHDSLTIGFEALQRTFLPEQGYYRGGNHRTEWDMNWALHYCARLVGIPNEPPPGWGRQGRTHASLRLFADGDWVKVATAGRRLYKPLDPPRLVEPSDSLVMNRTIALVDLDAKHSYAVSVFRLTGGTDHYLSFHGPRGTAEPQGLPLTAQQGGTLAGADVPYGIKWDSPWSKRNPHLMMFPFLYDVRRAKPEGTWSVRWDLEKYPNVHLRLHSIGTRGEVALSKGKPPGGGKPYELQWVIQHTSGTEPLATQFVEVLEAYEGQALITEVRPLTVTTADTASQRPVACQVVSGNRVDTIIHCQNPDVPVTTSNGITIRGSFAVWSEEDGQTKRVFLAGGTEIAKGGKRYTAKSRAWTGKIVSAEFEKKKIVVSPALPEPEKLVGRYARITNPQGNDATHQITGTQVVKGGVELTLQLDPRIGEGPVKEVHEDGVTSAVNLKFGGRYYTGKTLSNEDHSVTYKISGVQKSRAYINGETHPKVTKETLSGEFADKDGDGIARYIIYDWGPADTLTIPAVISANTATNLGTSNP